MTRVPVPKKTEAEILYKQNHTCCICHEQNLGVQVHHINGNHADNRPLNLTVTCHQHHDLVSSKSPVGKGFSPREVRLYKLRWEKSVEARRKALSEPTKARLIRFDGPDKDTVFLEVQSGVLRAFIDPVTYRFMGFNWGDIDIFPEKDRHRFEFGEPLKRISDCPKIKVEFSDGQLAAEVYLIWEDGRRHHVPNGQTLIKICGGDDGIETVDCLTFNAIPKGQPIKSIYDFTVFAPPDKINIHS